MGSANVMTCGNAPYGFGTTFAERGRLQAFTVASSGAVDTGVAAADAYKVISPHLVLIATAACHIAFGESNLADAVASDFLIPANTYVMLRIPRDRRFFKVIRDTADGNLFWKLDG